MKWFFLFCTAIALVSCSFGLPNEKSADSSDIPDVLNISDITGNTMPGIYCGGWRHDAGFDRACYWSNDVLVQVGPVDRDSYSSAMAVQSNVVYLAGSYIEGFVGYACYWKGNDLVTLTPFSRASGIALLGDRVIVAGDYYSPKDLGNHPCYWVNGQMFTLPQKLNSDYYIVNGVAVSGKNIYIVGMARDAGYNYHACYWKNGILNDLPQAKTSDLSHANAVIVSGNTVYIAGEYDSSGTGSKYRACYWSNDNLNLVGPEGLDSSAVAISVYKGIVYTAGRVNNHWPLWAVDVCYWSNSVMTIISAYDPVHPDGTLGLSVSASKKGVLVGGYRFASYHDKRALSRACYWTIARVNLFKPLPVKYGSSTVTAIYSY